MFDGLRRPRSGVVIGAAVLVVVLYFARPVLLPLAGESRARPGKGKAAEANERVGTRGPKEKASRKRSA